VKEEYKLCFSPTNFILFPSNFFHEQNGPLDCF